MIVKLLIESLIFLIVVFLLSAVNAMKKGNRNFYPKTVIVARKREGDW